MKSVRYKNMDLEKKEIKSNKDAQREVAEVEFAEEVELNDVNFNNQKRVPSINESQK